MKNKTFFEVNSTLLPESNNYVVKVLATDGFNTNSTTSGIFCIDSDLSMCGLKVLNVTGTKTIFEFIIANSLNQTLNNINWTLNVGDSNIILSTINFNLISKEDLFSYVEYQYNTGGNYIVKAIANGGNLTDSQIINITI